MIAQVAIAYVLLIQQQQAPPVPFKAGAPPPVGDAPIDKWEWVLFFAALVIRCLMMARHRDRLHS